MRLGIDLDGVVADFNQGWVDRYNRDFQASLTVDAIMEWDAPVDLTHFRAMSEFWDWARTCGEGRSIFRPLIPYPGAVETLTELERDGHEIVIVTTKPEFAIDDTHEWLAEHQVPAHEVHIVTNKAAVSCDLYLDDADHNLAVLSALRPEATVCRYVRPWNHHHPGVIDVADWDEVRETVSGAAGRVCR